MDALNMVDDLRINIARSLINQHDDQAVHTVAVGEGGEKTLIQFLDVEFDGVGIVHGPCDVEKGVQGDASDVASWVVNEAEKAASAGEPVTYDAGAGAELDITHLTND